MASALAAQLARRRQELERGAAHVGWKLGLGQRDPLELAGRLSGASQALAATGERLRAGDIVITGSIVQAPVRRGDSVTADLGALGSVELSIA